MNRLDHYTLLGVRNDASLREIRRAYRRLARRHHPDLNPRADAPERFAELAQAYSVLTDPVRRAHYDRARQHSRGRRPSPSRSPAVQQPVYRGFVELSPGEARHLAHHPLPLADQYGRTIVLPAGLTPGDEIALAYDGHRVILVIGLRRKT